MSRTESKVFKYGNYVWECKTSPKYLQGSQVLGGDINETYLKPEIEAVKKRWQKEGVPSGYYYVFPTNYISSSGRVVLDKFKAEYNGKVDIDYYDYQQVQRLLENLSKLTDMQSLVEYIQKANGN